MDFGLAIGDYLGDSLTYKHTHAHARVLYSSNFFLNLCLFFVTSISSNWSYFCRNRFCLYIAGAFLQLSFFNVEILTKNLSRAHTIFYNAAGAKSGWHPIAVQSSIWRRCCKWCNIGGAFQCGPEFWSFAYQHQCGFAAPWKFWLFVYLKHCVGSCSQSSSSLSFPRKILDYF